jgi:SulP family sulfate permease
MTTFPQLYVPKLLTVLRRGYRTQDLRRDLIAGLTVSIVALPLSMALAIASGTTPEKGLHTAIIAGFLISLLGGSRVQIGGPTAAFVPVVFNVIDKFGYGGLILCTLLAGLMLVAAGLLRAPVSSSAGLGIGLYQTARQASATSTAYSRKMTGSL